MSQRPKRPDLVPVSLAWSCLGVLLLLPRRDASPSQEYVAGTHLYTWVKKDKVGLSSLSMVATRRARLEPRTSRSRVRGVNRSGNHAALRVISINFLLVICTINALYKNRAVMRIIRTWPPTINYFQLTFYQLLLTTSRGTQRICSSKQIFPRNLPKCLNWLQKSLFILFCRFKVFFSKFPVVLL